LVTGNEYQDAGPVNLRKYILLRQKMKIKFNSLFNRFSDKKESEQDSVGQGKKDSSYQTSAIIFFGSIISLVIIIILLVIEKYFG